MLKKARKSPACASEGTLGVLKASERTSRGNKAAEIARHKVGSDADEGERERKKKEGNCVSLTRADDQAETSANGHANDGRGIPAPRRLFFDLENNAIALLGLCAQENISFVVIKGGRKPIFFRAEGREKLLLKYGFQNALTSPRSRGIAG